MQVNAPTTVRNIRDGTYDPTNPDHVYIGRANPRYGLSRSDWANPYSLHSGRGPDAKAVREAVIERYRTVFLPRAAGLAQRLPELRGKTLYCWCKPDACHGDVLAWLADRDTNDIRPSRS